MALTNPDLFDFISIILFLVAEGGIGSYRIMWSGGSESILIDYECCCPTKGVCSDYITVGSKRQKPLTGSIPPQASARKGKITERGDPGA